MLKNNLLNVLTVVLLGVASSATAQQTPIQELGDEIFEDENLSSRVYHVGRVSNETLNALYSGAEAFLFPSLNHRPPDFQLSTFNSSPET